MPSSLIRGPASLPLPQTGLRRRPQRALQIRLALNPWKTLEVEEGSSAKEVKRAYRKLALRHHPDVNGSEAQFLNIQHAYHTLIDQGRGKEPSHRGQAGWNFHDWYWQFRQDRTWGGKKHRQQHQAAPKAQGPTEAELASQLAGLRHRARTRRPAHLHCDLPQPHRNAAVANGANNAHGLTDDHDASAPSAASAAASASAAPWLLPHMPDLTDFSTVFEDRHHAYSPEQTDAAAAQSGRHVMEEHLHARHVPPRKVRIQSMSEIFLDDEVFAASRWPGADQHDKGIRDQLPAHQNGLDRLAGCIRYHLTTAFSLSPLISNSAGAQPGPKFSPEFGSNAWPHSSLSRHEGGHGDPCEPQGRQQTLVRPVHAAQHKPDAHLDAHLDWHELRHPLQEHAPFQDMHHTAPHANSTAGSMQQPLAFVHEDRLHPVHSARRPLQPDVTEGESAEAARSVHEGMRHSQHLDQHALDPALSTDAAGLRHKQLLNSRKSGQPPTQQSHVGELLTDAAFLGHASQSSVHEADQPAGEGADERGSNGASWGGEEVEAGGSSSTAIQKLPQPDAGYDSGGRSMLDDNIGSQLAGLRRRSSLRKAK